MSREVYADDDWAARLSNITLACYIIVINAIFSDEIHIGQLHCRCLFPLPIKPAQQ